MSNVNAVTEALKVGGHKPADRTSGGFRVHHVAGTDGDVGVTAVSTGRAQAAHLNYTVTLAKAFPHANVEIARGLSGYNHVFVRFPATRKERP